MKKTNKKSDFKNQIINRQIDEIEHLKQKISKLEIDCKEKDSLINSVDSIRSDLTSVVSKLKEQSQQYDGLIAELYQMKTVMNQTVFKGRWKLIRLLLK
jgi:chromosome segregation ATPase